MIANISPSSSCNEHTLNTLRYADRVKELRKEKNELSSEKDPSDLMAQILLLSIHNCKFKVKLRENC